VQAEADMLLDTARLSPSADADEIVQSRAGIARKPAGCVTTQPKAHQQLMRELTKSAHISIPAAPQT
jgi:hypothetical protein